MSQEDLFRSYQRKVRTKRHDQITDEERAANCEYFRNRRKNWTPEEREAKKLSAAKYYLRSKLNQIAMAMAESEEPIGWDTKQWEKGYD